MREERQAPPESVAVIGAGAWGTALAVILAERYARVSLWVFEGSLAAEMERTRENAAYLPGVRIPQAVQPTSSLEAALSGQRLVIFVVPSHAFRGVLEQARRHFNPRALVVSATKGIEVQSLSTMSGIMREILSPVHHPRLAVLSGPGFAREVVVGRPTAIVAAAEDAEVARAVQRAVSGNALRVYAGTDPLGVELGGAVKNVIAIAAGVVDGLNLGPNARAALITRGLAEIARLGVAMGAQAVTFAGLAGMGDLILTCTGDLSRNRRVGLLLAQGHRIEDILSGLGHVAEGVFSAQEVQRIADARDIEMPITRAVCDVLYHGVQAKEAVQSLLARDPKEEVQGL